MPDMSKQIIRHLHCVNTMQEIAEKGNLTDTIVALQQWQCKRLLQSHQALHRQARFRPALNFFIQELYGPKDFRQRDQDLIRLAPKIVKVLPAKALQALISALELNALCYELDFELARHIKGQELNNDSYLLAYRACDNQQLRMNQIRLTEVVARELAEVVKIRGIGTLLMFARKPAKLAGLQSLHRYVEGGFNAFKLVGDIDEFITPIVYVEQGLMMQMFDRTQPNPLPQG